VFLPYGWQDCMKKMDVYALEHKKIQTRFHTFIKKIDG